MSHKSVRLKFIPSRGHAKPLPLWAIAVFFLLSRYALWVVPAPGTDVGIYADYANKFASAQRTGVSVYDIHKQSIQRQLAAARRLNRPLAVKELETRGAIEYPPLAVALIVLPSIGLEPPQNRRQWESFLSEYKRRFRFGVLAADVFMFLLLVVLVRRVYPSESNTQQNARLLLYLVAGFLLWPTVYDRLDTLMTLFVATSLVLLFSRLHYAWSFFVLAIAVNYKLVPLLIAPVFILGSLPWDWFAETCRRRRFGRLLLALAARSAVLMTLVVVVFMPFFLLDGFRTLDFLAYHSARGIEIESTLASVLMMLSIFGQQISYYCGHGCVNVDSPWAPVMKHWSACLLACGLLALFGLLARRFRQLANHDRRMEGNRLQAMDAERDMETFPARSLARTYPQFCIAAIVAMLMFSISVSKVFSPQYLTWLVPFAALFPAVGRAKRVLFGGFLLLCLLTTALFPFLYDDLVGMVSVEERIVHGPTIAAATVLGLRNLLWIAVTVWLVVQWRRRSPAAVNRTKGFTAAELRRPHRTAAMDPAATRQIRKSA